MSKKFNVNIFQPLSFFRYAYLVVSFREESESIRTTETLYTPRVAKPTFLRFSGIFSETKDSRSGPSC